MKCIYHSADLDGHSSGAIVKANEPECELIGYNYGGEFPWDTIEPKELVYMVDVSLPMEDMFKLAKHADLIWIDHHISAIKEHAEFAERENMELYGLRETACAACELVWRWFRPEDKVPAAIELLGIYDSWRFTPETERRVKCWQYGMRDYEDTRPDKIPMVWDSLLKIDEESGHFQEIMRKGETIYDYQISQNAKTCRSCAFETDLTMGMEGDHEGAPLRCIAVNSGLMNSDVFKSVYDPAIHDAMLCFYRSKRGFWRVSIYSDKEEVDSSVYAKSHGGGGHKGAAGFQCQELPFVLTGGEEEPESNLILHAKREFLALGYAPPEECEDDPNKWIQENVIELLNVFAKQGHSGHSAPYCVHAFEKLASYKPLSPLTFEDDEWNETGTDHYQNKRLSGVFKEGKEATPLYIHAVTFRTPNGTCWSGSAFMPDGSVLKSGQLIDTSKTFVPKTFTIDVSEKEVKKDDWEFYVSDVSQVEAMFEHYAKAPEEVAG